MNKKELFKIKNSIKLFKSGNKIKFIFMNNYSELNLRCNQVSEYVIELLTNEISLDNLIVEVQKKYPTVVDNNIVIFFNLLKKSKIIGPVEKNRFKGSIVDRQVNFYSDIVNYPVKMQKELASKTVLILGLGGAGSSITYFLAQSGIKHFILLDNDLVEETNLGRQALYFEKDIGKYKVDVFSKRLRELDYTIKVKSYKSKITCAKDFSKITQVPNIVVNCLDVPNSYLTGKWVSDYYMKLNIPMINGIGYRGNEVSLGLTTIPKETICWNCANFAYGKNFSGFVPYLTEKHKSEAGITSPLANFISSIHAQEVVNVLCDELSPSLTDKFGSIDFLTLKANWEKIPSEAKICKFCKERRKNAN